MPRSRHRPPPRAAAARVRAESGVRRACPRAAGAATTRDPAARALIACALAAALGCGDGGPRERAAPDAVLLRPGDTLFERLEQLRVARAPESALPPDARALLHAALDAGAAAPTPAAPDPRAWRGRVPADAWTPHAGPPPVAGALLARAGEQIAAWSAAPRVGLEVPLGRVWLAHAGRRLRPLRRDPATGHRRWLDAEASTLFVWDAAAGRLLAVGGAPPGALEYGFERAPEPDLLCWERPVDAPPPADARALVRRVSVDRQHRPALAVTAPSTLALRVDALAADALELHVAAPDLGARATGARLRGARGLSDGVTVAVELHPLDAPAPSPADGARDDHARPAGAAPGPTRVWERRLAPGAGWVSARVDLAAWRGRAFELRLLTEPAGPGDAAAPAADGASPADATPATRLADHVLWGGLRLRGGATRAPAHPHVILIDVDTLRADRLGLYGAEHPTTPRLDAWAAREAIVFEHARATSDWTLPSTASLLTGLAVSQHAVTRLGERLAPAHGSLALRLAAAGYATRALTDGGVVVPENGFAAGFDLFDHDTQPGALAAHLRALLHELAARDSERPLFLFVQTYAVHAPYLQDHRFVDAETLAAAGALAERPLDEAVIADVVRAQGHPLTPAQERFVSALYDAGVARVDEALGPFLAGLDAALGGQPWLLVLTSDHGEELFDRGAVGHGHSLHAELLHVPLLLRLPHGPRGVRRDELATLLDVAPTLLHHAGLPVPDALPGRALLADGAPPPPAVARHRDAGWSIEWNRTKLLQGPIGRQAPANRARGRTGEPLAPGFPVTRALYDLEADPAERHDLLPSRPDLAERLRARLERWRAEHPPVLDAAGDTPPLSPEQLADLERLGYVGDG